VDVLNGIENTISGPAVDVSGKSERGPRAQDLRPEEVALDAAAHSGRRNQLRWPVIFERPTVHHSRAISGSKIVLHLHA